MNCKGVSDQEECDEWWMLSSNDSLGLSLEFDRLCYLGHCMKVGTQLMELNDEIFLDFFLGFSHG